MKFVGIFFLLVLTIGIIPAQNYFSGPLVTGFLQQVHALVPSNPNLFVSAENSQYNNYFAGPQVVQVVVADPNINRLDQQYGEPVVTVNGKRLRMAQATDGNWYGYFADRNQAITASNTAPVPAKGLNFGAFCKSGTIGGVDFGSQTKGFTVAENGFDGAIGLSVTGSKIPIGPLSNTCTGFGNGMVLEHVVRENKTLNTNSAGYGASAKLESAWPVIQLYDFSAIPTAVTVDYQAAGGDQVVNLTFDKIPSDLISVATDKPAYIASAPVLMTINDPQLGIDPTEEDSWTWGANANNNTLFYEAFDRNGRSDADGYCVTTAKTQMAVGSGPTGIAYDSAKGELFVTNYYSRTVSVISDATNSVVATIPVNNAPRGIAYDSAKGELFVTNDGGGNISVISDATNSVVATIPVGSNTTAITYDQFLGEIFVGDDGHDEISVINDATNSVKTTIPLSGGTWAMAYDSFKAEIFAVSQDSGVKSVSIVSPDSGSIRSTISLTDYPSSIAYDPTRGEVFVGLSYANSTSVISDSSDSVIATIPVGNSPTGVVYDPTRNDIFVTNYFSQTVSVINDLSNSVVATIPVRDVLSGAAYDSAKDEIFAISNSAKTYILPAIPGWTYTQTACSSGTVPAMQNLTGNLTSFMFDHNGRLTIDPSPNGTRVLDFQSNDKQILNGSSFTRGDPTKQTTASIGPGSEPITFIEMGGVNTGVFGNWDGKKKPDLAVINSLNIKGLQATFSYNNIAGSIVAQWGGDAVLLKSTAFEPTPNPFSIMSFQNGLKAGQKYHFLIQFNSPPTSSDQAELASQGITLLQYVSGNTFVASGIARPFSILSIPSDVRWTGQFLSSYKISPILAANDTSKIPSWALEKAPGTSLPSYAVITADLNIDANMTNVTQTITSYGGRVEAEVPLVPSITVVLPLTNLYSTITKIAQIDDVQFIDVVEPPLVVQSDNGTITANADYVKQEEPSKNGVGLLGDNVTVFVYDGGTVFPYHPDFGSRLWDQVGSCNEDHATNVAGILGGDGSMSNNYQVCYGTQVCWTGTENQWSGIAPHVNITSIGYAKVKHPEICNTRGPPSVKYNDDKQFSQDYNIISTRRIDLATMSISSAVSGACCLGQYTPTSIAIDNITTGAIANQNLTIFEAVGNRDPTENFMTVDPPATAKNSISVGEIYSKDYSISDTSGFGPTSDGRIKPDIVAPGCYGETPDDYLITTGFNSNESNYETASCGTSYATPLAAGVGSLIVEKWNQLHPNSPGLLPSTVKAILVHTALDLGSPGPSYKYGWGAINAKSAVELIDRNALQSSGHLINVANVSSGKEITFNFTSNTTDDVKATLVWDDRPAAPFVASTLVNQLNLTLIDPSGNHIEPYLLNSSQPNKSATTGNDTVNNVKVAVGNGIPGRWQAVVDGSRVFPHTSQYFTLIISNVVKRSVSMSLTPQTVTGQNPVTINATISDNDTGTSLPVSGSVTFGDGNSGGSFSTPNCYTQNGSLVCLVNYTPNSQGNIPITANYTGDLVHAKFIIPNISNSNNNTNQSSTACKSNLATVEVIPVKDLQSFTKTPYLIANFFAGKSIKVTNNSTNSHLSNYVTLQNVPDKYAFIHYNLTGQNTTTVAFEDRHGRPESNNNLNVFLQIGHKKDTISSMRGIELGGDRILVGLASTGYNTTLANSAEIKIPSGNARVMQKFRVPLNPSADLEQVPEPVRNFLNGSLDLENLKTGNNLTHYYFLQTVPDNYARLCNGIMNQNVTTIAFEDEYGLNSSNGNLNVFLQISHDSTKVNSLRAVQLGGDDIEASVNGVDEGSITKSIEIPMK